MVTLCSLLGIECPDLNILVQLLSITGAHGQSTKLYFYHHPKFWGAILTSVQKIPNSWLILYLTFLCCPQVHFLSPSCLARHLSKWHLYRWYPSSPRPNVSTWLPDLLTKKWLFISAPASSRSCSTDEKAQHRPCNHVNMTCDGRAGWEGLGSWMGPQPPSSLWTATRETSVYSLYCSQSAPFQISLLKAFKLLWRLQASTNLILPSIIPLEMLRPTGRVSKTFCGPSKSFLLIPGHKFPFVLWSDYLDYPLHCSYNLAQPSFPYKTETWTWLHRTVSDGDHAWCTVAIATCH